MRRFIVHIVAFLLDLTIGDVLIDVIFVLLTFDSIFSTSIVDIVFFGHVGHVFIYNLCIRLIYLFVWIFYF